MSRPPLSVLVVDDQVHFPRAARTMLSTTDDFTVAAAVGSVAEAMELLARRAFDVVLMDVNMAPMNGVDGARLLLQRPDPPLVVLCSAHAERQLPPLPHDLDVPFIGKEHLDPEVLLAVWRRFRGS